MSRKRNKPPRPIDAGRVMTNGPTPGGPQITITVPRDAATEQAIEEARSNLARERLITLVTLEREDVERLRARADVRHDVITVGLCDNALRFWDGTLGVHHRELIAQIITSCGHERPPFGDHCSRCGRKLEEG